MTVIFRLSCQNDSFQHSLELIKISLMESFINRRIVTSLKSNECSRREKLSEDTFDLIDIMISDVSGSGTLNPAYMK